MLPSDGTVAATMLLPKLSALGRQLAAIPSAPGDDAVLSDLGGDYIAPSAYVAAFRASPAREDALCLWTEFLDLVENLNDDPPEELPASDAQWHEMLGPMLRYMYPMTFDYLCRKTWATQAGQLELPV